MALYLVQHGKSVSKEVDPHKGLSEEGIEEVRTIAGVAAHYGVKVSRIVHSGKRRASQTAEIFGEALLPDKGIEVIEGINPLDDPAVFGAATAVDENLMIVGHLPFLERLIAFLVADRTDPPVFRLQNGGIVCLDDYPGTSRIVIRWALMPHIG